MIFSVAELANAARTTPHVVNTELARLMTRGIVARYAQGRYGCTTGVDPRNLLAAIDAGAYITGFYALFHHHRVTQAPAEITCFTNRRHNRIANRLTPAGKFRFICVPPAIYAKPAGDVIAPAEQALCDFAYLNIREGIDPRHLVTFLHLEKLNRRRLWKSLRRYPEQVRIIVERIVRSAD